jgi:nitrate reductase gamma subunit
VTLEHYFDLRFFLVGKVYLVFSLILDVAGGVLIIELVAALVRRQFASLDSRISRPEDVVFLALLLLVVILGYIVEGTRLAVFNPPGHDWSPVGSLFATAAAALIPGESLYLAHKTAWILHGLAAQVFVAYIPFSKMFHLFAAQITTSLSSSRFGGVVYED